MSRILMISSYVARDPVGLTATMPPLQRAGIEVVALPTVVLSNHPIRPHIAGMTVDPALFENMIGALEKNGWLGNFDAVFSGYLPSAGHVEIVAAAVKRMRAFNPALTYICDPIFGDDPKGHYIDEQAAGATRDLLLPLADVLTPNRFELSWLSGVDVRSRADALEAICRLRAFSSEVDTGPREENATDKKPRRPIVAGTSIPDGPSQLATVLVAGGEAFIGSVEKWNDVPHGTGDIFAGCLTAKLMLGQSPKQALGYAIAGVRRTLEVSRASDHLLPHLVDWENGFAPDEIHAFPLRKSARNQP
ncbi:pyridoxal kinase [Hyphomicrobium sp.]|uniref:pyridoxal kinase n=1 Tax=Hyphomicrobium sp. TaxID=82 RepID=UPI001D669DBA|nr:pyridoxal kinase [Hyphomicrobium sp.]MBY0560676.1 pyridoxal kinase [Hyphomicrobium sp.]